ncbi:hypothetical protein [Streptomyces sp. 8P21H-1]|uniref:hypothetical protein n=1 Tax=Streptomyces sp. 8P21H-1 TaxID=2737048 RepID=UPI00156E387A|nr:hypothetical protein [Streptomyces sp. 8P21H-1]NSL43339.1 hypothetical protein [Streptomyces sp. 8P21H-1]
MRAVAARTADRRRRATAYEHIAVAHIVDELVDEDSKLDALGWGQDPYAAVRNVLQWPYAQLPAAQTSLFRRLGLHPGPDISTPAAAALARLPPHSLNREGPHTRVFDKDLSHIRNQ